MGHFRDRMSEHLGINALTGKIVKGNDDFAIKEHLLFCNHAPNFEGFLIFSTINNEFEVTLMKKLLINGDHSPWIKNKQSLPLKRFHTKF